MKKEDEGKQSNAISHVVELVQAGGTRPVTSRDARRIDRDFTPRRFIDRVVAWQADSRGICQEESFQKNLLPNSNGLLSISSTATRRLSNTDRVIRAVRIWNNYFLSQVEGSPSYRPLGFCCFKSGSKSGVASTAGEDGHLVTHFSGPRRVIIGQSMSWAMRIARVSVKICRARWGRRIGATLDASEALHSVQ